MSLFRKLFNNEAARALASDNAKAIAAGRPLPHSPAAMDAALRSFPSPTAKPSPAQPSFTEVVGQAVVSGTLSQPKKSRAQTIALVQSLIQALQAQPLKRGKSKSTKAHAPASGSTSARLRREYGETVATLDKQMAEAARKGDVNASFNLSFRKKNALAAWQRKVRRVREAGK